MTLINRSQIENPERGTAGLASATQLIDITDSKLTIFFDTSLASLNYIPFLPFQDYRKPSQKKKEKHETKRGTFRENLRKAMHMNAEILIDLARY